MNGLKVCLTSLLLLYSFLANAQETPVFQHIKTGMSQSSATQILEDSYGFLWIGTPNGINKYDGSDFQVYEKSIDGITGLTDGYIESIYEDNEGNLLVGTNQGLNIYDRDINAMKPYPFFPDGEEIGSKYIGAIIRLKDHLWLGTDNSGIYRYNIKDGDTRKLEFESVYEDGPNNNFIVEIFQISEEKILVITQASVYIIDEDMGIISRVLDPQDISSAIQDEQQRFWLGSHNGDLMSLQINQDNTFILQKTSISPEHSILSLEEDSHGDIWIGSENDGLSIYSPTNRTFINLKADERTPNSISNNSIWSLHKASNGVMWVGPFKQGLSFYDPEYYKFKLIRTDPFKSNSLSNNIVNCFMEDDEGNLWIGTDGGGLNYWKRSDNSFDHYSFSNGKLNSNVVLCLLEDSNSNLWVGTWAKGLVILNSKNQIIESWTDKNSFLGSNNVIDIMQDSKGRIWITTLFGGVHIYYPESKTHKNIHLKSGIDGSEVISMARLLEDKDGNIWVGTQVSGLFKLIEQSNNDWEIKHFQSLRDNYWISNDFINTLFEDENGQIWVGTQAGLNLYNANSNSFSAVTKANGLMDDAIKGIIKDNDGYLWLSTSKGIIRYDPDSGESLDYDENDGLQGNEFNGSSSYTTRQGEFLFGGSNGFNIFTPKDARKRNDKPKVYISSLKIFNQPVLANDESGVLARDISETDSITLSYDKSVINFDFRALTFRHPEKVEYAYYLDGFESDWNYVGNSKSATYTNLSPGPYTLKIKSTNADGVWNDQVRNLAIFITPPFWSTWWFRLTILGLIVLVTYSFYQARTKRIRRYQEELEREIKERTNELQVQTEKLVETADELSDKNEEIQRFAFAVSHDLKSPLNSIQGISELIALEINSKKPDHSELENYLDLIKKSCKTMSNLIVDITKIARLGRIENNMEVLDSNEIMEEASSLVFGRLNKSNTELRIDENLPAIVGDKNRMVQVFENLIDNAVKYMGNQENPSIHITHEEDDETSSFIIRDNGMGMEEESLKKLFSPFQRFTNEVEGTGLGLYMIKQVIESHGGKIKAASAGKGKGSTFTVVLPKKV